MARRIALFVIAVGLSFPAAASANGDPASDYLLVQDVFLPFNAKIDSGTVKRLQDVIKGADNAGFKIKVALILTRYDLGTAFSLYRQPQRYSEFWGLELSFVYRERLLVVMPNGYGFSVNGKANPLSRALKGMPEPGLDATKEANAATAAVRRLASAAGHRIVIPKSSGSQTRDRIIIASAAVAAIALIVALVLFRRERRARRGLSGET